MLTRTECDVRFASQARHAADVNQHAWLRPFPASTASHPARPAVRARFGAALIALGTRLAPASQSSASPSAAQ
jgi:hypothetical protein